MQLQRLVDFHKTIGDTTRIQLIALLKEGPLHGQKLAEKLGLTPPTISYHMTKLREIDIVYQRRDKNTIYFYLNEKKLKRMAEAILQIGSTEKPQYTKIPIEDKDKVIQNFFTEEGELKELPAQRKKKLIVLEELVSGLEIGRTYDEADINQYIKKYHDDTATIRREFITGHFMHRENGKYKLNPKEMWLI